MNKSSIFKSIVFVATTLFLLASCDKDFNEIGSDVIGEDHFDLLPDDLSTVVAFNQATGAVQSNNMLINSLGIYNNPVFGKTKADFVSQIQMATANPTFDLEKFIELDSVVLSIPYFSRKTETDSDGNGIYELDSIYGSGKINLKIFESGVVLNDLIPPDFEDTQKYYSDDTNFNTYKIGNVLNNSSNPKENTEFETSLKEIITYKRDKGLRAKDTATNIEARLTPRIRLHLDTAFFKNKIINAPDGKLINNSIFKEYFRGLYFHVEDAASGTLMKFRFSDADVTLHYREYSEVKDGVPTKFPDTDALYPNEPIMLAKTFVLRLTGNTVNLFNNTPSAEYAAALQNFDTIVGDEKLYLKGGQGSVTLIDLFGPDNFGIDDVTGEPNGQPNEVPDELDIIRYNVKTKNWLINEANLTFHIDTDKMNSINKDDEPQRVYLYDVKNKRPLFDYFSDQTTTLGLPKFNKFIHDGLIQRGEVTKKGTKYRVRITNHIRNLVKESDSTNVRLGLVITEAIENNQNAWLETPVLNNDGKVIIDRVPQASVMNPLGTVLHGTGINVPFDKRVKLEIYYTKPN
ncbi:DUF4270 domain-containing protein [Flavobacterium soli]|uniref:DUF4270 domain-containing protein n=1 Tax=Flavobacterium soli TaxID=344881 RepID=UPI0004109EED|nr:DUF4270 domain-containing protein [Flavobacterium soli]